MRDKEILAALGAADGRLLGQGGEARVYAIGESNIARIHKTGASMGEALQRQSLLDAIGRLDLPFATPAVVRVEAVKDRIVTIERRLPGVPTATALQAASGDVRRDILLAFLEGTLALMGIGEEGLRNLNLPVMDRVSVSGGGMTGLVHVDYALTNCLSEGSALSAVLDFGPSTMIGDTRFNAWAAVAYLDTEISPAISEEDRQIALGWLAQHGLNEGFSDARLWLARYWSFAKDDAPLMAWCQRVLNA
jgi:hypothetical protein